MKHTNIVLVGLGPHAKRIYFNYLNKHNCLPKLIVDLESEKDKITQFLNENDISNIDLFFVPNEEKDLLKLSLNTRKYLKNYILRNKITHAIISTEPKSHFAYSYFFINNNVSVLMDKPITAPVNVNTKISQANKIIKEYNTLCEIYKKKKLKNKDLIFAIQCQRRFQKGYKYVKDLISEIIKKYNIPITYIDIYHNDGMWNMPDEFIYRENHPYKYGYGKIFHSGYHFIDLLTWLIEENNNLVGKNIDNCSVYAEKYAPIDFFNNFTKYDYNQILSTTKFNEILDNSSQFSDYGEIDVHSIINFYNGKNIMTSCSLNLMQSGVSRRAWVELPKDTYKSNGRIRHERLNVCVGPLLNIQIHSYQAYEIKERKNHGSTNVGDIEHFDIYIFRNSDLIGGKPFEKISLCDIVKSNNSDFNGYNEQAREICLEDFLKNKPNDSDILLHKQSILLTSEIYKSIIYKGRKIMSNINFENENEIAIVSDEDFEIEPKKNSEPAMVRYGARGIVLNGKGEMAVFIKEHKNEYKLPGGGIEKGEDPKIAFIRECAEEVGVKVEIEDYLGTIIEDKSQENFKQKSFVFVGKKVEDLKGTNFTEQEKQEGAKITWMKPEDALNKMRESLNILKASKFDSVYRTKFMVLRDIRILEYYLGYVK